MAIEWEARINSPLTVADVVERTEAGLAELLPIPALPLAVKVYEATAARLRGGVSEMAGADVLAAVRDPFGPEELRAVSVVFEVPELDAVAFVGLEEFLPRDEDPETGLFATVTASRDNASQVLGIATVTAFAECGDSVVIDESLYFALSRFVPPAELLNRLRPHHPVNTVKEAVDVILRKTTLRNYEE